VFESPADPAQFDLARSDVFDLARRGYDREQVDYHVGALAVQLRQLYEAHQPVANRLEELLRQREPLTTQIVELEGACQREHRRAERAENELHAARRELERLAEQHDDGRQGFGYRVEKLLRSAEQEAGEVRSHAAGEATSLLERARNAAAAHRQKVEQSLIHRTETLAEQAAARTVELDERDRQIGEQADAAADERERMLGEVRRQAEQLHHEAVVRAEQVQLETQQAIQERLRAAGHELGRLRSLHDGVRNELGRLLESLATEYGLTPDDLHPAHG
jgi:hypothetical protein